MNVPRRPMNISHDFWLKLRSYTVYEGGVFMWAFFYDQSRMCGDKTNESYNPTRIVLSYMQARAMVGGEYVEEMCVFIKYL